MIKVSCKPLSTGAEDYMKTIPVTRRQADDKSLIIDNHRPALRTGAFEVELCTRVNGELKQELFHSKLESKTWPNMGVILGMICNLHVWFL